MHPYQHLLPGMSAAAAEQFAILLAAASPDAVHEPTGRWLATPSRSSSYRWR